MKWISVKDKMPPDDKLVVVWWQCYGPEHNHGYYSGICSEYALASFDEDGWDMVECCLYYSEKEGEITHWVPLPESPEKDKK